MFLHHSDQMSQRSKESRVVLCMPKVKVLSVSQSVSDKVTYCKYLNTLQPPLAVLLAPACWNLELVLLWTWPSPFFYFTNPLAVQFRLGTLITKDNWVKCCAQQFGQFPNEVGGMFSPIRSKPPNNGGKGFSWHQTDTIFSIQLESVCLFYLNLKGWGVQSNEKTTELAYHLPPPPNPFP